MMTKLIAWFKRCLLRLQGYTDVDAMVYEFHLKSPQLISQYPRTDIDDKIVRLRARLIMEESFETITAMYGYDDQFGELKAKVMALIDTTEVNVDLVGVVDGCADVDYVVAGTRLSFGVKGLPVAKTVHRSNMAKLGPGSWIREDGKQMKPQGWQGPDILGELITQGWQE
jgi:predicted HAD superfamily Cof-like phosphohydrolase